MKVGGGAAATALDRREIQPQPSQRQSCSVREKADATEAGWTCRIGDVRADLSKIGIFDDFYRMPRRNAEIHERFGPEELAI